jgi:hypothetical protein
VTDFLADDHHLEHIEAAVDGTGHATVETGHIDPGEDGGPTATYTRYDFDTDGYPEVTRRDTDSDGSFETTVYDRDSDGHIDAIGYDSDGDGRPDSVISASDRVSDDVRHLP